MIAGLAGVPPSPAPPRFLRDPGAPAAAPTPPAPPLPTAGSAAPSRRGLAPQPPRAERTTIDAADPRGPRPAVTLAGGRQRGPVPATARHRSRPRTSEQHRTRSGAVPDLRVSASPWPRWSADVHALYKLRVDVFVLSRTARTAEMTIDADPAPLIEHRAPRQGPGGAGGHPADLQRRRGDAPGRVCTAAPWRGQGLARGSSGRDWRCGDQLVEIGAQAHLQQWYDSSSALSDRGPEYWTAGRIFRCDAIRRPLTGVREPV